MSKYGYGYCAGAFAFFGASIAVMVRNNELHSNYARSLTDEQLEIYQKVKMERFKIWSCATLGAFVFAMFLGTFQKELDPIKRTCFMVFVFFLVQYFVYSLYPKQYWMLDYVKTPEQTQSWLVVYRSMKWKYHAGFVFGLVAFSLYTHFLNCFTN
jgi:hypothetical protein